MTPQFTVEKAYPDDTGHDIARLDVDAIFRLRISPGGCIEIEGNNATIAETWRTDTPGEETGIVRLGEYLRQSADVAIGDTVEIRKAEVTEATSLTLRSPEAFSEELDADARKTIKLQLLQRPVTEDDIVPVWATDSLRASEPHLPSSPGQVLPFIVSSTDPQKPVIVTEETTVTIQ